MLGAHAEAIIRKGLAFAGERVRGDGVRAVIVFCLSLIRPFSPPPPRRQKKKRIFRRPVAEYRGGRALPIFRRTPRRPCSRRTRVTFIPRAPVYFHETFGGHNSCRDVRIVLFASPNATGRGQIGSPARKPRETSGSPTNRPRPADVRPTNDPATDGSPDQSIGRPNLNGINVEIFIPL